VACPELRSLIDWVKSGRSPHPESDRVAQGLIEEATRQRVAPLLYAAVTRDPDGWPAAAIEGLRERYHSAFSRGGRQLDLAARLMRAFERAGLRVLPMKGVALAESAYDSVAERPMGDIDLLALDDWHGSVRLLEEAGLVEGARADHAWSFRDPHGQVVELHHSVTSCPGLYPVDTEGLWRRREQRPAAAVAWRPAAEDLLVQLALHAAFQHALTLTVIQYLDFRRVSERASISGPRLRDAVETAMAGPAVAASFVVADSVAGLPLAAGDGWPRSELPARLERWLKQGLSEPGAFLLQPPSIIRVRWELSRGRRWALLKGTCAPPMPQQELNHWRQARRVLARTSGLLRRWL
jgi:Uncharacterised nucleotidyltransferase